MRRLLDLCIQMQEPQRLNVGTCRLLWDCIQLAPLPKVPLDRRALQQQPWGQPVRQTAVALPPFPVATAATPTLAIAAVAAKSSAAALGLQPSRGGRPIRTVEWWRMRGLLDPCKQMPEPLGVHVGTGRLLWDRVQLVALPSVPLDWRALQRFS
jgi:hypothetical protein